MKTHLLLFPGLLCDEALWSEQIAALSSHCTCRVADMASGTTLAEIARHAIQGMPEKFAVAGLSMGGYTALEVMRQVPERVERLALLDTSARADTAERIEIRKALIARVEKGEFNDVIEEHFQHFVHPSRLSDIVLMEKIRTSALNVGPEAYVREQKAIIARPDSLPSLAQITCPTLVLCGAEDVLTPPALHDEIAHAIAGAELVKVADCGHLSTLEAPEAVNAALQSWLGIR